MTDQPDLVTLLSVAGDIVEALGPQPAPAHVFAGGGDPALPLSVDGSERRAYKEQMAVVDAFADAFGTEVEPVTFHSFLYMRAEAEIQGVRVRSQATCSPTPPDGLDRPATMADTLAAVRELTGLLGRAGTENVYGVSIDEVSLRLQATVYLDWQDAGDRIDRLLDDLPAGERSEQALPGMRSAVGLLPSGHRVNFLARQAPWPRLPAARSTPS
ncbi:hypothetical protein ACFY1P_19925 [Streptomyces sp. NPDC001407]|uniref:hypothetical protein n=1 Tax=Streptomyces sp. NPDC001407 TaxID=3364573 RepID=UPI0036CAC810